MRSPSTKNKIAALAFAIAPVLITGLLAYGANIYYDLDQQKIVSDEVNEMTKDFTISGTGNVLFSTTGAITQTGTGIVSFAGNVGIGTTTPSGALHVAGGQCVTGDTRLRARRRRKRQNERGEWIEEDYFEDCRIDQIKAGDEILTLDENTGKLVVSRVNALMDMGVKEIYRLTTATGKTIRTTANHPYLARNQKNQKPRVGVFIDDGNMFYAQKKAGWRIDYNKLKSVLADNFRVDFMNYYLTIPGEKDSAFIKTQKFIGWLKKEFSASLSLRVKPLKYIFDEEAARWVKKGNVDTEILIDVFANMEKFDVAVIVSGDSDFRALADVLVSRGKKIIFAGFESNMAWELRRPESSGPSTTLRSSQKWPPEKRGCRKGISSQHLHAVR